MKIRENTEAGPRDAGKYLYPVRALFSLPSIKPALPQEGEHLPGSLGNGDFLNLWMPRAKDLGDGGILVAAGF
jgi:hypothetical protein